MLKCIMLRGLQGSGKSTWAAEQVEQYPGRYKVISTDALRNMLDNGKWSKTNEQFMLEARDNLILLALSRGHHVIVDATHLHPKHEAHLRELVKGKAIIEIQDFTHVSLEECIARDLKRFDSVGERVIRSTYNQFLRKQVTPPAYDPRLPDAIICDLDGTLALMNGRNPYDASTCEQDLLNKPVASIVSAYHESAGVFIILVSGRGVQHKPQTARWLDRHGIEYNFLFMRTEGDSRPDAVVKEEIYRNHIAGQYNIRFVLDDRRQVVEFWRSLGLTCLQVAEGDF